jgi:flagellar basal-body rod protein FlgF
MWRGLYTAAAGMVTEMTRTDTIANNLANASSTAFKKDQALSGEFEPMLIRRINDNSADNVTSFKGFSVGTEAPVVGQLGLGSYTRGIATDFAQGSMQITGNPLDLAISGSGYFAVQTPQGVRYTRAGNFYRSAAGQLETVDGQAVLDRQGRPVTLPGNATNVQFGTKGEIFVNHQQVDQLQFVQFNDNRNLLKQGNNLYYTQNGAQPQPAAGEIQQGMLEHSNVNVIADMVSLINNYRMYEAGSKAVTTQDSMLDKSVNEVGRMT